MRASWPIAACLFLAAMPAQALSERDCSTLWTTADADSDGVVSGAEATRYLAAIRLDGRVAPHDGRIGRPSFMSQCRLNVYASQRLDAQGGLTRSQAGHLAAMAGYSNVQALEKDPSGVWRGTIAADGQTIDITIQPDGRVEAERTDDPHSDGRLSSRPWGV